MRGRLFCVITTCLLAGCMLSATCAVELKLIRNANEVLLTWPLVAGDSFYLESTTNLTAPSVWRPAMDAIAVGTNWVVTNAAIGGQRFYRLQHWQILFDGSTTASFRGYQQADFPSTNWIVNGSGELGPIVGTAQVDLISTNQFADFELRWEWKTAPGGNSGVNYRATEEHARAEWSGPEYQLLDDPAFSVPERNTMAAAWNLIAPTNKVLLPTGQWNRCRIVVQSNHVEHWLNDRRVVSYELDDPAFRALVNSNSTFNVYPNFATARRGHIALRHENLGVWFRNIRLRELPAN